MSYASPDQQRVGPIASELAALGYRTFFDQWELQPGVEWQPAIRDALGGVRAFVAMISQSYVQRAGWIQEELQAAHGRRTPILPVLLDPVPAEDLPGSLRARQWLELIDAPPREAAAQIAAALRGLDVEPFLGSHVASAAVAARLTVDAKVLPDLPADRDALGFEPLVVGLKALLQDERTQLPLSIAVTAPWGAGKSSVMLQLRGALDSSGWVTTFFGAWLYERRERLWAALAIAVYEQPQRDMRPWRRWVFRLRLERERLGAWRLTGRLVIPFLAAAVALTAALSTSDLASGLPLGGLAAVAGGVGLWRATSDAYKRSLRRYGRRPDYSSQLGFTEQARRDVDALITTLTRDGRRLAVFVDDLDRLSSANVVEVVETINQIFNGHEKAHRCLFVLGFDREVVAASIEVAYAGTVERLEQARSGLAHGFGFEFLSKLVQLSIAIPEPRPDAMERLLGREPPGAAQPTPPADPGVAVSREDGRDAAELAGDGAGTIGGVAVRIAAADVVAVVQSSPSVVQAEIDALHHLSRNPRQVKRFCNAFRLQLYVAFNGGLGEHGADEDQLAAIGKWVALRLRWPALAEAVDDEPRLLAALERMANGEPEVDAELTAALLAEYGSWFGDRRVAQVLREPEPTRRIAELPFESFLRVA